MGAGKEPGSLTAGSRAGQIPWEHVKITSTRRNGHTGACEMLRTKLIKLLCGLKKKEII